MGKKQEPLPLIGEKAYEEALQKIENRSSKKARSIFTRSKDKQKERIMEQNAIICRLEFELEKTNKKIDGLTAENHRLLTENNELRSVNSALQEKAVDYEKTISETTAKLREMQEHNAQLLAECKESITPVPESFPSEARCSDDRVVLAKLKAEVEQLANDMHDSRHHRSTNGDAHHHAVVCGLREDQVRALTKIDVLEADLALYKHTVMQQRDEIASLNVLIERKEEDVNKSGIFINQLNQLLETVQEDNMHLQHKLARAGR